MNCKISGKGFWIWYAVTTRLVSFFKENILVVATPVWTISKSIVSFGKLKNFTLQNCTSPTIWNRTGSPFMTFIFNSSGYLSFCMGLSKGLKTIDTSCWVWGGIIAFIGIILNAFSLFSSHLISAFAFPPLNKRNFWVTDISILSFSNLSFLNANFVNVFWISSRTKITSAKTRNLKVCL